MEEIINALIPKYTSIRRRKMLKRKEIEQFAKFYLSSIDKYKQDKIKYSKIKTSGLRYIIDNQDDIYNQISS